jgi:hypothetical protein
MISKKKSLKGMIELLLLLYDLIALTHLLLYRSCHRCVKADSTRYNYWKFNWHVRHNCADVHCCRDGFMKYYQITKYELDRIVSTLKQRAGVKATDYEILNEAKLPTKEIVSQLQSDADKFGITFTKEMQGKLFIPTSGGGGEVYAWLSEYFSLYGDVVPNADGELHIDRLHSVKAMYDTYVIDMKAQNKEPLSPSAFGDIRTKCFPHVKARSFKNVSSKCETCARLAEARAKVR